MGQIWSGTMSMFTVVDFWSTEKFTHIYSISTNNVYLSQYQKKMRKTKINVCRKLLKNIYIFLSLSVKLAVLGANEPITDHCWNSLCDVKTSRRINVLSFQVLCSWLAQGEVLS